MRDIVWRISEDEAHREPSPTDAASARTRLEQGNRAFVELTDGDEQPTRVIHLTPADLGIGVDGLPPPQRPYAALVSCADARVPAELLLNAHANELFVVRVAGGVLTEGAMGSLDFAVGNLTSMVLVASLGHTGCGAVSAAVSTYLDPTSYLAMAHSRPLLALVQNIYGAVRLADHTLHDVHGTTVASSPGYRTALNDLAVLAQAGVNAAALRTRIQQRSATDQPEVSVVYGVYDLASRYVGVPGPTADWAPGLVDAPEDGPAFGHALREIAFGPRITHLLDADTGV